MSMVELEEFHDFFSKVSNRVRYCRDFEGGSSDQMVGIRLPNKSDTPLDKAYSRKWISSLNLCDSWYTLLNSNFILGFNIRWTVRKLNTKKRIVTILRRDIYFCTLISSRLYACFSHLNASSIVQRERYPFIRKKTSFLSLTSTFVTR